MSSINGPLDQRLLTAMTDSMNFAEQEALKRALAEGQQRTPAGMLHVNPVGGKPAPTGPLAYTLPRGYGHPPEVAAKAKGKMEFYMLEEKSSLVWVTKPVVIGFGVSGGTVLTIPGELFPTKEAATEEVVRRTRETVRRQAKCWSEALTVAQLEGGTLDDAELVLLKAVNAYLEATK